MTLKVLEINDERKSILLNCKKDIEKIGKLKIEVNQDVVINGDPLQEIIVADVVNAISIGFSPERAFNLFRESFGLEIISLPGMLGNKKLTTIKARLIGRNGITRRKIEYSTKTFVSIYEKNVSIIGEWKNIYVAKDAIMALIKGRSHSMAYKILNK